LYIFIYFCIKAKSNFLKLGDIKTNPRVCLSDYQEQLGQYLLLISIHVHDPVKWYVLFQILASGVCHTDAYTLGGDDSEGKFPCILGHEGGGVVESVGEGVTSVQPGG